MFKCLSVGLRIFPSLVMVLVPFWLHVQPWRYLALNGAYIYILVNSITCLQKSVCKTVNEAPTVWKVASCYRDRKWISCDIKWQEIPICNHETNCMSVYPLVPDRALRCQQLMTVSLISQIKTHRVATSSFFLLSEWDFRQLRCLHLVYWEHTWCPKWQGDGLHIADLSVLGWCQF